MRTSRKAGDVSNSRIGELRGPTKVVMIRLYIEGELVPPERPEVSLNSFLSLIESRKVPDILTQDIELIVTLAPPILSEDHNVMLTPDRTLSDAPPRTHW